MTGISSKPRYEYIDLAKGICIILVVFSHFDVGYTPINKFTLMLQSFRMPLYFCLSGLFFSRYGGLKDFVLRKTNKLLIPFCSFYVLSYLLCLLRDVVLKKPADLMSITGILNESIPFNEAIWFLLSLFVCGIIFYLIVILSDLSMRYQYVIIIACSLFVGYIGFMLGKRAIDLPIWIDSSMTAVPFYAFGYVLRNDTDFLKENLPRKELLIPLFFVLMCYTFILGTKPDLRTNDMVSSSVFRYYTCGIFGTLGILFLSKKIKRLPVVSYCGRYSICILLTHVLFQKLVLLSIMTMLSARLCIGHTYIAAVFTVIYVFLSYYVIIPLMVKYMPHLCAQKNVL